MHAFSAAMSYGMREGVEGWAPLVMVPSEGLSEGMGLFLSHVLVE